MTYIVTPGVQPYLVPDDKRFGVCECVYSVLIGVTG